MNWWWSVALAAIGIAGLWLAGSNNRAGWAIGLSAQVLWVVYAIATGQWGFILSAVAYGLVYGRNWVRWSAVRQREARFEQMRADLVRGLDE